MYWREKKIGWKRILIKFMSFSVNIMSVVFLAILSSGSSIEADFNQF